MRAPCHTIDIRDECMTQLHGFTCRTIDLFRLCPRTALQRGLVCAMQSEYRTEDTELYPTQIKFRRVIFVKMPANIVPPPAIRNVCGSRCEVGLECQRAPLND